MHLYIDTKYKRQQRQVLNVSDIYYIPGLHALYYALTLWFACCALYLGGGGYSHKNCVGVCGLFPKTLIQFMTKICEFPNPTCDLTKTLRPAL